jgi:hypothetical protein
MQRKVTLSFDEKVYERFNKYCKENAIMLSRILEIDMEEIMKKGEKK